MKLSPKICCNTEQWENVKAINRCRYRPVCIIFRKCWILKFKGRIYHAYRHMCKLISIHLPIYIHQLIKIFYWHCNFLRIGLERNLQTHNIYSYYLTTYLFSFFVFSGWYAPLTCLLSTLGDGEPSTGLYRDFQSRGASRRKGELQIFGYRSK